MSNSIYTVELSRHIPKELTVLKDRTWGFVLRKKSYIDLFDEEDEKLEIVLPGQITSVTSSFLEELLENVIMKFLNDTSSSDHTEMNKAKEDLIRRIELRSESKYDFSVYLKKAVSNLCDKEITH